MTMMEYVTSSRNMTNDTGNNSVAVTERPIIPLPVFDELNMIKTLVMGSMFFISLFGNLATLIQMHRMRRRKSTINTLIINLATADLFVTFFCMGTEAIWAATVQWHAGEVMCKMVKFAQVFALNLSTYVTVVISLDRCCVILDPMSRNKAPQRVRTMIVLSWCLCALFSIPQILIFKVEQGPFKETFVQCIDMGYEVEWGSKAYNIASALFSYVIPLLIMGTAYGLISGTITKKSREFRDTETSSSSSEQVRGQVHRSHLFRKAKRKALRMSIVIVAAFIVCWTPYYVLFTCFTFMNRRQMPRRLLLALSFIGLSNSLLNPMIYGAFHLCKVHTPRSSRRKNWASFTMKSPVVGRRAIPQVDSYLLPGSAERPFNVLTQKNNMLVIRRCDSGECHGDSTNPCLYVLYKVGHSSSRKSSNVKSITS